MTSKNNLHGWVHLDKPYGMTSTQAVGAVKRLLRPRKIGHAGTLDPLATGSLPLALGEATKTIPYAMDARKVYEVTVRFGEATTTCDAEGEVVASSEMCPTNNEIKAALPDFTGEILQVPPAYSAIKVDGKRAYDLARAGEEVELQARPVQIDVVELIERIDNENVRLKVVCGKGTYIRSLARDLAESLGTVGHVAALRRLSVGFFTQNNIFSLAEIEKIVHSTPVNELVTHKSLILPPEVALDDILEIELDETSAGRLRNGQMVEVEGAAAHGDKGPYKAMCQGTLIAIVGRKETGFAPLRVFNLP